MEQLREFDEVLFLLHRSLALVDPVGFALEPLATMSDPDNDIKGDYVLRLSFLIGQNDKNKYVSIFQAYLAINKVLCMAEDEFENLCFRLLKDAITYRSKAQAATQSGESMTIGPTGPDPNLGSVLAMAHDMLTKIRH